MGLPSINIAFEHAASSAITRSTKGVVACILKDAAASGALTLTRAADIPSALTAENRAYLTRAFVGYVSQPRRVLAYVLPATAENMTAAFDWLATQTFDYLVGPPDTDAAAAKTLADWVTAQRDTHHLCRAVLPEYAANHWAIVNFATADSKYQTSATQTTTLTPAQMCSRIAGLLAGTPMTMSCTFAPMTDVEDIARLSTTDGDAAVEAGKLILVHDGRKVKVGRGVTSLTTVPVGKSDAYKSIKIVELLDMVDNDLRMTIEDNYIGKYANVYANKLVLLTAIKTYFKQLEREGLLDAGSTVDIDVAAQRAYLIAQGVDADAMTEQEVREANTGKQVFLATTITPVDAIEDVTIKIAL